MSWFHSPSGFLFPIVWIVYSLTSKVNLLGNFNRKATGWSVSGTSLWCHQSWMTRYVCVLQDLHHSWCFQDIPLELTCQKSSFHHLKFKMSQSKYDLEGNKIWQEKIILSKTHQAKDLEEAVKNLSLWSCTLMCVPLCIVYAQFYMHYICEGVISVS